MNLAKVKRLEAHGWRVGNAEEFLGLTDEEKKVIDKNKKAITTNIEKKTK